MEVRITPRLAAAGVEICRAMRKNGALHVWRADPEVKGLWPDTPKSQEAVSKLDAAQTHGEIRVRRFFAQDPKAVWQTFQPRQVGPRLKLAPAWAGVGASKDTLVIDPLTSFGAGDHPSTLLNLDLLGRLEASGWRPEPGRWLADVGAGSGILSLAMALLFNRPVVAVDPEPASRRAVARNRGLNPLAGPLVHMVAGTHACLKKEECPLIAANLPGPILLEAAAHISGCLKAGGWLVLSGFRSDFTTNITNTLKELGLTDRKKQEWGNWAGISFEKTSKRGIYL